MPLLLVLLQKIVVVLLLHIILFFLFQRLNRNTHKKGSIFEILVTFPGHIAQMQGAQPRLDAGDWERGEGDEVAAQYVFVVNMEGKVGQVRTAHIKTECL